MNNKDMNSTDPWDRDSYETGSTKPPKSYGGLIAILFVAVIFLCGISSVIGFLNIRLTDALQNGNSPSSPINLFEGTDTTQATQSTESGSVSHPVDKDVTLEINKSPTSVDNIPQEGGLSLQDIYLKAIDSVVSISCTRSNGSSSGTGVVLSANGYVITNCHVVEDAQAISLLFTDNRVLPAVIVGADPVSDLAVLYVNATDLTPAEFGDSSALRVGDAVAAIGDPLGSEFRGTLTNGIVSAINRDVTTNGRTMTLIQTNAALNSGNSGGPLLNCYGQVIGINTLKIGTFTDSAGVEGLGFAIPSTTVKEIVDQLISQGYVSGRPSLGITGDAVSELQQRFYRLPAGVLIQSVTGNAQTAGLSAGDIILTLDGTRVTNMDELNSVLYANQVGDQLDAVVYRSGKQYAVKLTLQDAAEG